MKIYAELTGDSKKQLIKNGCDNKLDTFKNLTSSVIENPLPGLMFESSAAKLMKDSIGVSAISSMVDSPVLKLVESFDTGLSAGICGLASELATSFAEREGDHFARP